MRWRQPQCPSTTTGRHDWVDHAAKPEDEAFSAGHRRCEACGRKERLVWDGAFGHRYVQVNQV